jgi:hypothetical protein
VGGLRIKAGSYLPLWSSPDGSRNGRIRKVLLLTTSSVVLLAKGASGGRTEVREGKKLV